MQGVRAIRQLASTVYSEIGSKEAGSNAGASAMRNKERVLSGIMQALLRSHLYRLKQSWVECLHVFRNLVPANEESSVCKRIDHQCRHVGYEEQGIRAIRHHASTVKIASLSVDAKLLGIFESNFPIHKERMRKNSLKSMITYYYLGDFKDL